MKLSSWPSSEGLHASFNLNTDSSAQELIVDLQQSLGDVWYMSPLLAFKILPGI